MTLEDLIAAKQAALGLAQSQLMATRKESSWLKELDTAFGRTGVQSFALEGVLGELQVYSRASHRPSNFPAPQLAKN